MNAGILGRESGLRPARAGFAGLPRRSFAGNGGVFAEYRMTLEAPLGSMAPSIRHGSRTMEFQAKMPAGTRLIAGTISVIAGGALVLGYSGLLNAVVLQRGWPLVLIALALAQLALTMRSPSLRGLGLLFLGNWFFMNTMTDWAYEQYSLPLLLVAVNYWIIAGGTTRAKRASLKMDRHVA
jgi:hypothetical protein